MQNNFFRTVRNFYIDLTAMCATCGGTGLHWQVAQATSLVNVVVTMSTASNTNQYVRSSSEKLSYITNTPLARVSSWRTVPVESCPISSSTA